MSDNENTKSEMSFLDHLEVLRWHLVRSSIAILTFSILAFIFKSFLFDKVILAQMDNNFWTYRMFCKLSNLLGKGDSLCLGDINFNLINISMSGQFTIHMMTSFTAGIIMAFPYILYEVWRFISPALKMKEKKYARALVFAGSVLFMIGILFGYYLVSPLSVQFFGNYHVSEIVTNQIDLSSYISNVTSTTFACGLVFELPLIVYFLSKIGLVTPALMRKFRKHAIVVTLTVAAILTPPDITSQILLSIPLLILYEFSIYVSKAVAKQSK